MEYQNKMAGTIGPIKSGGGCAHGLPPGACPICSGGAGGTTAKKSGQMSWSECYAIGQAMKAAKQRALDNAKMDQLIQARTSALQKQTNVINNRNIPNFTKALPLPVQNTINNLKQVIAKNINRLSDTVIKQIGVLREKIELLMNKFSSAAARLASELGELKNKIKDNIDKNIQKIKKKLSKFLDLVDELLEENEIEETDKVKEDHNLRELIEATVSHPINQIKNFYKSDRRLNDD